MNLPNPFPGVAAIAPTVVQVSAPTINSNLKFKRAGQNGTLITVILDESGSMTSCWDTTIAGFNEYVKGQKSADTSAGEAALTLIKFDSPYIKTVYANRALSEVPELDKISYRPSGGTNLLDAIGDAITSTNQILSNLKKKDRPGVIITIMTDGGENASTRYSGDNIKAMVKAGEEADYTFVFLGANIDTFAVGSTFGMSVMNSVSYSTKNMVATMASTSASTTRIRAAKMAGVSTNAIYESGLYTADELKKMK
jgi:hypothetical protein